MSGVAFTCPTIDSIIKSINTAIKNAEYGIKKEDLTSFTDVISELEGLESMLEDVRSANSTLRDWGEEQYQKVNDLEFNMETLEMEINELKNE